MRWWRRRPPEGADLGAGVWRQLAERTARAVRRVHQVAAGVEPGHVRDALDAAGAELDHLVQDVRAACAAGQRMAPSAGLDVPGGGADLHRGLSRVATSVAQLAERAAMVATGAVPPQSADGLATRARDLRADVRRVVDDLGS